MDMTTPRKSRAAPAKRKSTGAAKRPAAPKKAKPVEQRSVAANVKSVAKGTTRPDAHKDPRAAAAAKGAAAAATKGATAKGAKGAKTKSAVPAVVRPLGVLPPESRARTQERHAPAPALPARVAPAHKGDARSEPSGAQPLSAKDVKFFENLLMEELKKIRKEMGHLETTVLKVNPRDSSGDLSGYSFHMADAGTDAMEREKAFLFASSEGRREREIVEALQRIYDGTYGTCENCGNPIARARLEAVPYVRLCVSCKQKEEQASRSQGG
jgi:RNA polymerase-binding transcription factor